MISTNQKLLIAGLGVVGGLALIMSSSGTSEVVGGGGGGGKTTLPFMASSSPTDASGVSNPYNITFPETTIPSLPRYQATVLPDFSSYTHAGRDGGDGGTKKDNYVNASTPINHPSAGGGTFYVTSVSGSNIPASSTSRTDVFAGGGVYSPVTQSISTPPADTSSKKDDTVANVAAAASAGLTSGIQSNPVASVIGGAVGAIGGLLGW